MVERTPQDDLGDARRDALAALSRALANDAPDMVRATTEAIRTLWELPG